METEPQNTTDLARVHTGSELANLTTGDIGQSMIEELNRRLPPDRLVSEIEALLCATRATKHGIERDTRAIEVGLRLALAYQIGLPVARAEVRTQAIGDGESLEEKLARAPEFRRLMQETMKRAEGRVVDVVEQKT